MRLVSAPLENTSKGESNSFCGPSSQLLVQPRCSIFFFVTLQLIWVQSGHSVKALQQAAAPFSICPPPPSFVTCNLQKRKQTTSKTIPNASRVFVAGRVLDYNIRLPMNVCVQCTQSCLNGQARVTTVLRSSLGQLLITFY